MAEELAEQCELTARELDLDTVAGTSTPGEVDDQPVGPHDLR